MRRANATSRQKQVREILGFDGLDDVARGLPGQAARTGTKGARTRGLDDGVVFPQRHRADDRPE